VPLALISTGSPTLGNSVRIYRVSLDGAKDVSNVKSLAATNVEPSHKESLVDLELWDAADPGKGESTRELRARGEYGWRPGQGPYVRRQQNRWKVSR
jgi:hypothetical protein